MIKHLVFAAGTALALASTTVLAADQPDKGTADTSAKSGDTSAKSGDTSAKSGDMKSGDTRDWKQVDSNSDNLVSPEEMEKYLNSSRDSGKKAATK